MIYTNIKNGKIKSFVVSCDCGCTNGLEFKVVDDSVFVSSFSGDFYLYQGITGIIKDKLKYLYKHLRHKQIYMADCCMSKDDIKDFLYAINNLVLDDTKDDCSYKNDSKLCLYRERVIDDLYIYGIYIKPILNTKKYILGKDYRAREIVYTKEEWKKFVKACNKYLEKEGNT